MTRGFIDSASVHSALGALTVGKTQKWTPWDRQSLHRATYLLMHGNIRVMSGPGPYAGAHGPYSDVLAVFPELEEPKFSKEKAERKTKWWLSSYPEALSKAWEQSRKDPSFQEWSNLQRELFWIAHVRMYGALFNEEFIPYISKLLECSESDLSRVHSKSGDLKLVTRWKDRLSSEDARLAERAWLLSALVRGRFHEYLARDTKQQLISHPYRRAVGAKLKAGPRLVVLNTEQELVNRIIGSALLETSADRRIHTWIENVARARKAISLRKIALPDAALGEDAEWFANQAAKRIGLPGSPARMRRELDWLAASGLGGLVALVIAPWAGIVTVGISPLIQQAYRHLRGASVGDDLAKLCFSTSRWYSRLGNSVPGRVEDEL